MPSIELAEFPGKGNRKEKETQRTVYSALTSEKERIKHLGFRKGCLMCKQIVVKRNKA